MSLYKTFLNVVSWNFFFYLSLRPWKLIAVEKYKIHITIFKNYILRKTTIYQPLNLIYNKNVVTKREPPLTISDREAILNCIARIPTSLICACLLSVVLRTNWTVHQHPPTNLNTSQQPSANSTVYRQPLTNLTARQHPATKTRLFFNNPQETRPSCQ